MHALHRPHLARAMTLTAIAAVLAVVLSLALTARLSDLVPSRALAPTGGAPPALQQSTARQGWNMSPFAPLLSGPLTVPWAQPRS
jgi:hypothetical protein